MWIIQIFQVKTWAPTNIFWSICLKMCGSLNRVYSRKFLQSQKNQIRILIIFTRTMSPWQMLPGYVLPGQKSYLNHLIFVFLGCKPNFHPFILLLSCCVHVCLCICLSPCLSVFSCICFTVRPFVSIYLCMSVCFSFFVSF